MNTDTQSLLFCVGSAMAAGAVMSAVFGGCRRLVKLIHRKLDERITNRAWEQAKQVFAQRPRARILEAGQILTLSDGREIAVGFTLDCRGIIPAYSRGPDGEYLIGCYTSAELLEIARRPSEFVELPE